MWLNDGVTVLLIVGCLLDIRTESQFIIGDNVTLPCQSNNVTAGQTYVWADQAVNQNLIIYQVNDVTDTEQTGQAASKEKYTNFEVQNSYPTSVNMIIKDIQPEDASGPYQCYEFDDLEQIALHNITLEGIPKSVKIACTRQNNTCPSTVSDSVSSMFTCTCTAVAAYPGTLQLAWTGAAESIPSSSMESPETGLYDYHGEALITPTDVRSEVKCVLTGYTNAIDERERNATYTFAPPSCTLDVELTPYCKTANLTCRCSGAPNPLGNDLVYGFYDEDGALIGGEQTEDEMTLIDLDPDQGNYSFSCRGCNGVNYGDDSFATANETCIPPPPYQPVCNISVTADDCQAIQLECICDAEPADYNCSFYSNYSSLIQDRGGCSVSTSVSYDTTTNYTCEATNDAGTGEESSPVSYNCTQARDCIESDQDGFGGKIIYDAQSTDDAGGTRPSGTVATFECPGGIEELSGPNTCYCSDGVWIFPDEARPACEVALWFIILMSVIGALALLVIAGAAYWFLKVKGKGENEDGRPDGGIGAVSYAMTNAALDADAAPDGDNKNGAVEPPVYGKVNKPKKSKNGAEDKEPPADGKADKPKNSKEGTGEPPVYGKVDKSKKSKEVAADGDQPDPPLPEVPVYGVPDKTKNGHEIQYADLAHDQPASNRVHQSENEPTQYAEVKHMENLV